MPVCRECGRQAATVEMRRTPKGDALCKMKLECKRRKAENRILHDIGRAS